MGRRTLTLRDLRRILASFGVGEDPNRGKGSHTMFFKTFDDGAVAYPVPTHGKEVKDCYVRGCRKKFRLTASDGIADDDFYGR